jgi:phage portal protein BeeE
MASTEFDRMSVISYGARAAVGNALAMDEYSGKFFANGAHPSIVLSNKGKMEQDQIDLLQRRSRASMPAWTTRTACRWS